MVMNKSLNRQGFGLLIGLAVQYVLGMAINLYVSFPAHNSPHAQWVFTLHNLLILLHLIIGTLLVIGSIAMIIRAMKLGSSSWKLPASLGLISLVIAWVAGDTFITTQSSVLSYVMSLGFLAAIGSYVWGLYRSKNTPAAH